MQIKHIVINGGGPTIFNSYGALKQASNDGIWNIDSVESFRGTSAGAMLSVILALQYSWEDLDDYIIKRPWHNLWQFNLLHIYDYYANKGIYGKHLFVEFYGPLFRGKDVDVSITLKEFHTVFKKAIYMYAVDIERFELVEFSHESHPDMPVIEAVRASSALPILFEPVTYNGRVYIDGGILLNYPFTKCAADPDTILGVKNVCTADNTKLDKLEGIFEYLSYILNNIVDKIQMKDRGTTLKYELEINTGFIDYSTILSLANSATEREHLIKCGSDDAIKSISKFMTPNGV
jgi:predicted acylesterase/phospholipase RssA